MNYAIKEIFFSLQGEGAQVGRPAVFCRFSGCNLWSGREADRAAAVCDFCDTDFLGTDGGGGGRFADAGTLAESVAALWPRAGMGTPLVVCTGGEPLLQLDSLLVEAFHGVGFEVAVETNGTRPAPPEIDWLTVSPKAGTALLLTSGDELKLVHPQEGLSPEDFEDLDFAHFYLQPRDGPERAANVERALRYCLERPKWRLSLQVHKILGIP